MMPKHLLPVLSLLLFVPFAGCAACESTTAKTPPTPSAGPAVSGTATGPQIGVIENLPPGAEGMNAQALAFYQQGLQAFANAELQQAISLFNQAIQADPKAFQAYYSLGVVQERLGMMSQAESSYEKSFKLVPKYERAIIAYGLALAKQGKLSEADNFLTEKRGHLQKSAEIAAALAEVKSLRSDTGSAQTIAQEALKIDPGCRAAMMTIARDHFRTRRLDLSLYALRAILDGFDADNPPRDKDNAEAHLLRGVIWAEQGFRGDAMGAFKKALELRPDLISARLRLATYLLESGDAYQALPLLQKAVKYDADNLAAHLSLGDAYRLTGAYPLAKQEFEWVEKRDSNLPQVHYNYGLLYLFATNIPGMTPLSQVEAAMASLNKYEELRKKTDPDATELINRAKLKKAEIEATIKASQPQPKPQPKPQPSAEPADTDAGAPEPEPEDG